MREVVNQATFDRPTFDRLVLEHLSGAQRFAIRLTGDVHAAEDVVQDALLRAHRAWQTFRGESTFKTWLFQIIINCFRDRIDQRDRKERVARGQRSRGADEDHHSDPAKLAQTSELAEIVASEISRLPPRQREVLVLISYEQHSITQVAGMLNVTEQNIRTNLHLARERLRQRLARYLEPSTPRHERTGE